ncbi:MAG: hypothetical protein Q9215_001996 [Flavoplaca cf. flavocitrina]
MPFLVNHSKPLGQMEPQVLYRVCYGTSAPTSFQKSLLSFRPALLHEHRRHRVLQHDYPAIVPQQCSSVRGTYVRGLTDGDLYRLDIFEGVEYERRRVKINILEIEGNEAGEGNVEGEEVTVETYIWVAGKRKLEDGEWDFAEFRREKMHNWITSSEEYDGEFLVCHGTSVLKRRSSIGAEVDEAIKNHANDPTGGRGLNGSITERLEAKKEDQVLNSAV